MAERILLIEDEEKLARMVELELRYEGYEVEKAFDGRTGYPIITGDYQDAPTWGRHPVTVGTPVAKPTPVFTKLDESIVEAELARYAGSVPDDVTGS